MKMKYLAIFVLLISPLFVTSCVPLAAGAAGGYLLHKEGYRVQNPVKKADVRVQSPVVKRPKGEAVDNYAAPNYGAQSY